MIVLLFISSLCIIYSKLDSKKKKDIFAIISILL